MAQDTINQPTPITPLASLDTPTETGLISSLRTAAHQAAQDDLTRRSDSPVATSPSKNQGGIGSASVSGVTAPIRIAVSPLGGNVANANAPVAAAPVGAQNTGAGVSKDGTQAPTDSITLGQLKQLTAAFPKPKVRVRRRGGKGS